MDTDFPMEQGLAVFTGGNGHGKSTLLEAVHMLSVAKSIRGHTDREIVNHRIANTGGHVQVLGVFNESNTSVRAQFDMDIEASSGESTQRVRSVVKSWRINGVKLKAVEFVGRANVVLFEAQDLEIVLGGASTRRRYLDILIGQFDTEYVRALMRLNRIRKSRNALLKGMYQGANLDEEMPFWDDRFRDESLKVIQTRRDVMSLLQTRAAPIHAQLSNGEKLELQYQPRLGTTLKTVDLNDLDSDGLKQLIYESLIASKGREQSAGNMVIGPHLDDFGIRINSAIARQYASRGQARTAALALRLAEASLVAEFAQRKPVIAFDDVLSEMDASRRSMIIEQTSQYEQTLLTATDLTLLEKRMINTAQKFTINQGQVHHN